MLTVKPVVKDALRTLLAVLMVGVGITHFTSPDFFVAIVPKALPAPLTLVYVSGFFEILGGLGLLVPRTRRAAAWGLVALYVAVFPANINMAINEIQPAGGHIPVAGMWLRLPFQVLFIAYAYWFTRPEPAPVRAASGGPRADTSVRRA